MERMRERATVCVALIVGLALCAPALAWAQGAAGEAAGDRARALVSTLERVMFPDAKTVATLQFTSGTRSERYEMVYYARDRNQKVIVRMTAPAASVGNDILMVDQSVWTYEHEAGRVMKVASNLSFGGTGFSYGDVVRLNFSDNYEPEVRATGPEEVLLELTAKSRTAPYHRIELAVDTRHSWPLRGTYYARSGAIVKEVAYSNVRDLGAGRRPASLTVTSPLDPGAINVLTVAREEPRALPDRIFNKRNLEARLEEQP